VNMMVVPSAACLYDSIFLLIAHRKPATTWCIS